jgi:hypothetical protein
MSWHAYTPQKRLHTDTILAVYEQPSGPIAKLLVVGTSIAIRNDYGPLATVTVVEATENEAIIEMSIGNRWRVTEMAPKELPYPLRPPLEAPAIYWRITGPVCPPSR